jgi:hypothetical protein
MRIRDPSTSASSKLLANWAADEDEAAFDEKLKQIATAKPRSDKPRRTTQKKPKSHEKREPYRWPSATAPDFWTAR